MRPAKSTPGPRRGSTRRLSSHVLTPLVTVGLLAAVGGSAAVTVTERGAAIRALDARAATVRDLSAAPLKRTGRLASSRAGMPAASRPLRMACR